MNVTMCTLNNWILYFIYLHKGLMSVITIIGVQLDYARSIARAVQMIINRIPRWGYASHSSCSIEIGPKCDNTISIYKNERTSLLLVSHVWRRCC